MNSLRRSVEDRQQAFHELDSLNKGEDLGILGHMEMMAFFFKKRHMEILARLKGTTGWQLQLSLPNRGLINDPCFLGYVTLFIQKDGGQMISEMVKSFSCASVGRKN